MAWTDDFIWVPDETPTSAGNLNKMNEGIREAHAAAEFAETFLTTVVNGVAPAEVLTSTPTGPQVGLGDMTLNGRVLLPNQGALNSMQNGVYDWRSGEPLVKAPGWDVPERDHVPGRMVWTSGLFKEQWVFRGTVLHPLFKLVTIPMGPIKKVVDQIRSLQWMGLAGGGGTSDTWVHNLNIPTARQFVWGCIQTQGWGERCSWSFSPDSVNQTRVLVENVSGAASSGVLWWMLLELNS